MGARFTALALGLLALGCKQVNPEFDSVSSGGSTTASTGTTTCDSTCPTTTTTASTAGTTAGGSTTGVESCQADNGGCAADAVCDDSSGAVTCTCADGFFGDGITCTAVALGVVRVELPCTDPIGCAVNTCLTGTGDTAGGTLQGDPSVVYDVTFRIRGVIEQKTFEGGTTVGFVNIGGVPAPTDWNEAWINIVDPSLRIWLNAGTSNIRNLFALDYEVETQMRGGTSLVLGIDDGGDLCAIHNVDDMGQPIVVPGIPPAPNFFDGQFIQLDLVSAVPGA